MRYAKRLTLRAKFILVLLVVGIVPMQLIGWAGYYFAQKTIISQAGQIRQQALQQSIAAADDRLYQLQMLADALLLDEQIGAMLSPQSSAANLTQYIREWQTFNVLVNKYTHNFATPPDVTVYGSNTKVFTSWISNGEPLYERLQRNDAFRGILDAGAEEPFGWTAPHADFTEQGNRGAMLSYAATYIDPRTGAEGGRVVVSSSVDEMFGTAGKIAESYAVYTKTGTAVYATDASLDAGFRDASLRLAPQPGETRIDWSSEERGGERMLLIAGAFDNDWFVVEGVPYEALLAELAPLRKVLLFAGAAAAIVSVVLGHVFIGRIIRPVLQLVRMMKDLGHGRWKEDMLDVQADPEIGILQNTFNRMATDLKLMQRQMQQEQKLKLEMEFNALLSQIQPHFVKNTLASINGLALQGRTDQIHRLVDSLGYFMSTRIYHGRPIVPLEEELQALEHYVNIMRIRYPDKFDVIIDIPDTLFRQEVPRFMLQPIVENSIYHGMQGDAPLMIWVQAYMAGEHCVVVMMDNGKGTDVNPLRRIEAGREESDPLHGFGGIGLTNIDQRIRLYFGPMFGLQFDSAAGGGTRVEINLPKRMEEKAS